MNTFRTATISGTRKGMSKEQEVRLCDLLDELPCLSDVRHGDCVGVDEKAHEIVRSRYTGLTIHIHPPVNESDRAFCEGDVTHKAEAFLKRDRTMVNESDVLLAFPDTRKERLRSGTWTTIRHSRRRGSPIVIVFPEGEVQRENIDFVDHEESIETYGYDPDRHSSHANVQDCLEEKEELRYADIAPEKHTIVINQHVLVGFKMFRKYHESGTRHDTLIITHAAVVKRLRRRGIFTSVVDELVRLLQPRFVVIEAVLRAGGMPEWCLKNGFSDKYATGSFTKCVAVSEHPTAIFDIETQSAIRCMPGSTRLDQIAMLQVSCASVLCLKSDLALDPNREGEAIESGMMRTFWRDSDGSTAISRMIELLDGAELIVCYNGLGFDFPVIRKHYRSAEQYASHLNKTHDIFTRIREVLGQWPKLDALLKLNGLELKTANGLEAIKMWEEGRRDELQTYCECDVRQCARLVLLPTIRVPGGGVVSNHIGGIASAIASVRHSNGILLQ